MMSMVKVFHTSWLLHWAIAIESLYLVIGCVCVCKRVNTYLKKEDYLGRNQEKWLIALLSRFIAKILV